MAKQRSRTQSASQISTDKTVEEYEEDKALRVDDAYARNDPANNKPAPAIRKWFVSVAGRSGLVSAPDKADAWALFCDAEKEWPSPRACRVELYDPALHDPLLKK